MKTARYVCTHCSRKFEAEEKEILECPGCFWSTSVKKEEEFPREPAQPFVQKKSGVSFVFAKFPLKPVLIAAAVAALLFIFWKAGLPALKKAGEKVKEKTSKQETMNPASAASPAVTGIPAPAASGLTPGEQNILNRRVQISADREPSDEENKILSEKAVFKTGFSERLPSQPWTIENFKEMISQQEKFFQVPLPRSYKNKLYELFETKYLPGSEAFKNGNLLEARNYWVESLAFPIYANNPQKHRGVILTMTRPFITDTLSKIGAINSAMTERGVREKEEQAAQKYAELTDLIDQKKWAESLSAMDQLSKMMDDFSNPSAMGSPAPYPPAVGQIDRDVQASLAELLTVQPPSLGDLEPMRADILRKKRIVESFLPEALKERQTKYDEAMDKISQSNWPEAEKLLRQIDSPLEMMHDAAEKIKILKKLQRPAVSSVPPAAPKKQG